MIAAGAAGCETTTTGLRDSHAARYVPGADRPTIAQKQTNADAAPKAGAPSTGTAEESAAQSKSSAILLVEHEQPVSPGDTPPPDDAASEISVPADEQATRQYPIDLPTALRLADADNLQVTQAREQIQLAYAEQLDAQVLWLPSLRAGFHVNKHAGPLQATEGNMENIDRTSIYAGAGAAAVGSGSPMIPGVFANFQITDAIFQPLAAEQRVGARRQAATAQRNNTLLDVSLAYLELLRAMQDAAIARELHDKTRTLSDLTDAYARTGQGLQADADRLRVELGLRANDIRRTEEVVVTASARLAQLLRLDPCVQLAPLEPMLVPLNLIPPNTECAELVAQGLYNRPETMQNRHLVGEAVERLRREQFAPLIPSVLLGASYGGFGGGDGSTIGDFSGRVDVDASLYWNVRNFGFGEVAARQNAGARVRLAQIQEMATLDLIAREVTEANAQTHFRREQITTAQELVTSAVDSYEHNLARIQQGQGLPIEALQSVQALLQARREYLRVIIEFNAAQFTLQRALGWVVPQDA